MKQDSINEGKFTHATIQFKIREMKVRNFWRKKIYKQFIGNFGKIWGRIKWDHAGAPDHVVVGWSCHDVEDTLEILENHDLTLKKKRE